MLRDLDLLSIPPRCMIIFFTAWVTTHAFLMIKYQEVKDECPKYHGIRIAKKGRFTCREVYTNIDFAIDALKPKYPIFNKKNKKILLVVREEEAWNAVGPWIPVIGMTYLIPPSGYSVKTNKSMESLCHEFGHVAETEEEQSIWRLIFGPAHEGWNEVPMGINMLCTKYDWNLVSPEQKHF